MNFILTNEQRQIILTAIQEFPLKSFFQSASILLTLPELKEKEPAQEEVKNENESK